VLFRHPPFTKPLFLSGLKEPFQPRSKTDDETVDSFFQRRFGSEVSRIDYIALGRGINLHG